MGTGLYDCWQIMCVEGNAVLDVARKWPMNPFTAAACKCSGLEHAWTRLQNGVFFAPITSTLNAARCDQVLSHASAKTKTKKASGFQISHFYWSVATTSWQ